MSEGIIIALITSATTIIAALIGLFGSLFKDVGQGKDTASKIGMIGLVATMCGFLGLITGLTGSVFYVRQINQAQTTNPSHTNPEYTNSFSNPKSLVIDGVSYSMPDPNSSPHCVAQEVHTNGENIVTYNITVPDGWVMMWDSWKAKWDGDSYNQDGLLIIKGPYNGTIEINTGGSCSGPIEWYDFIYENRWEDYLIPSRQIHTIQ
jgi:hypothetical protein